MSEVSDADPYGDAQYLSPYPPWLVAFDRVYIYVFGLGWATVLAWFWYRRSVFPISRRMPQGVMVLSTCLVLFVLGTLFGVQNTRTFNCLAFNLWANTLANVMISCFFVRAWKLYLLSRLQHEKLVYAARRNGQHVSALAHEHELDDKLVLHAGSPVGSTNTAPGAAGAGAAAGAPKPGALSAAVSDFKAHDHHTAVGLDGHGHGTANTTPDAAKAAAAASKAAVSTLWYTQHRYLGEPRYLVALAVACYVVLSLVLVPIVALRPIMHSTAVAYNDTRCVAYEQGAYQTVVAVVIFGSFAFKLRGVTDSLLFHFELNANAVFWIYHIVADLVVAQVTGDSGYWPGHVLWVVDFNLALGINLAMPLWHSYRFQRRAREARAKFHLRTIEMSRTHNTLSATITGSAASGLTTPKANATGSAHGKSSVVAPASALSASPGGRASAFGALISPAVGTQGFGNNDMLASLLAQPSGFHSFRLFLDREFSTENLLFYDSVRTYRHSFSKVKSQSQEQQMVEDALDIRERYLLRGAPLEVNLPFAVLREITRRFDAHFAAAETEAAGAAVAASAPPPVAAPPAVVLPGASPTAPAPSTAAIAIADGATSVPPSPATPATKPANGSSAAGAATRVSSLVLTPPSPSNAAAGAAAGSGPSRHVFLDGSSARNAALASALTQRSASMNGGAAAATLVPTAGAARSSGRSGGVSPGGQATSATTALLAKSGPPPALGVANASDDEESVTLDVAPLNGGAAAALTPGPRARASVAPFRRPNGIDRDLFWRAEKDIYGLMANDSFVRYLQSSQFASFEAANGSLALQVVVHNSAKARKTPLQTTVASPKDGPKSFALDATANGPL